VALVVVPVLLLLAAIGLWALDTSRAEGEVLRNVEIAGRPMGGLGGAALDDALGSLAEEYPAAPVRVETPEGAIELVGSDVGLSLDVAATRAEVLAVGRSGSVPRRFASWLSALVRPRTSDLAVTLDASRVEAAVVERDPSGRVPPTEPGITASGGDLAVVPGVEGRGLDPATVVDGLRDAAVSGDLPVVTAVAAGPIAPRFTDEEAARLAELGRERTAEPLPVQAGDTAVAVPSETLRTWLHAVPVPDGLRLEADPARAAPDVDALLADVGADPVDASFVVEGDRVVIIPDVPGSRCCAPDAAERVAAAVLDRPEGPVQLSLVPAEADRTTADAEALGIVQPIGSFTTSYPAGQSRVVNIHRIADLTRGVVIEPGGSFSVNEHIGPRTEANGFTTGGVIQNGVFEESVGGGISQFATTLFNAAFFGGLEYSAYQSHSIYISRYPYGREATLSYPEPDLVVENPSPHGVLIWPTYTASSITVTLWSTPWATGAQTAQTESPVGACTRVTTERTRTFVDGRTAKDRVFATYRPEEGVTC
jgi:vancomycin resistance protein YoaR